MLAPLFTLAGYVLGMVIYTGDGVDITLGNVMAWFAILCGLIFVGSHLTRWIGID